MIRYSVRTTGPYTASVWDNETNAHTVDLFVGRDAHARAAKAAHDMNRDLVDRCERREWSV